MNKMKLSENDIIELLTENGGKFRVNNLDHAYIFCKKVALGHYENFPVASVAIPSSIRKHFYSIYSYCRIADDLGDVVGAKNKQLGLNLLDYLAECANNKFKCDNLNPLFLALSNTVDELKLPAEPFVKLTVAFKKDINFSQPESIEDLLDYCQYSANPVGELVLRLFGEYNQATKVYSDCICTGLQLVNFLQDVSVDIEIGRIYIPKSLIPNITIDNFAKHKNKFILFNSLNELYLLTGNLFKEGEKLLKLIHSKKLRFELAMIISGGTIILEKVVRLKTDVLFNRPKLNGKDKIKIFLNALKKWK